MEIYLGSNDDEKLFIENIYHGEFVLSVCMRKLHWNDSNLLRFYAQRSVYSFYLWLSWSLLALRLCCGCIA